MTEGRVFVCTWKQLDDGFHVSVVRRPRLFAEGDTFEAADYALYEVIMQATGDGENVREYDPPAPTRDASTRAPVVIAGNSHVRLLNVEELYDGGVCPRCEMPLGRPTSQPLRIDGGLAGHDGAVARTKSILAFGHSPRFFLFSESFLALLTPAERARFDWRPVERKGRARKKFFQIIGSRAHVPVATRRGPAADSGWRCDSCGWIRRHMLLAKTALRRVDSCFTTGDPPEFALCFSAERWSRLVGRAGAAGLVSAEVDILGPAEVNTHPKFRRYSEIQRAESASRESFRADIARHHEQERRRESRARRDWPRLLEAAKRGDAKAQFKVATTLENAGGDPVPTDYRESFRWMKRAASQGHRPAILELPGYYLAGKGVKRNVATWRRMMERAALRYPVAYYTLALHYENGIGVPKSLRNAAAYYEAAARHGNDDARFALRTHRPLQKHRSRAG
jgi:hypothetical protein